MSILQTSRSKVEPVSVTRDIKAYRVLYILIDNRPTVARRFVLSLTEKIPGGWLQSHNYWVGENLEIFAYVWGNEIAWPELEVLINYTFVFMSGEYDVQG